nr:spore germination protein [Desulforamulus aquiferis]
MEHISQKVLSNSNSIVITPLIADILVNILIGKCVLIIDACKQGIVVESKGGIRRGISEPPTERTVRGSREGFIEDIGVNLA